MSIFSLKFGCLLFVVFASLVTPSSILAQTLREQMIGTWTLVDWIWTFLDSGEVEAGTFGKDAFGHTIYSDDGYMCAALMRTNRSKFTSKDWRGGTSDEKLAAYDGYIAYCGKFEVNEVDRTISTTVDTSLYPNWTGSIQKRFASLSGDRLTLTTPTFLIEGKEAIGTLVWEKARR